MMKMFWPSVFCIPSTFINWNALERKSCPLFPIYLFFHLFIPIWPPGDIYLRERERWKSNITVLFAQSILALAIGRLKCWLHIHEPPHIHIEGFFFLYLWIHTETVDANPAPWGQCYSLYLFLTCKLSLTRRSLALITCNIFSRFGLCIHVK